MPKAAVQSTPPPVGAPGVKANVDNAKAKKADPKGD